MPTPRHAKASRTILEISGLLHAFTFTCLMILMVVVSCSVLLVIRMLLCPIDHVSWEVFAAPKGSKRLSLFIESLFQMVFSVFSHILTLLGQFNRISLLASQKKTSVKHKTRGPLSNTI